MGLITNLQIILLLTCNILETSPIITPFHYHHFRRYIDSPVSDWEIGLREATYNALVQERIIKHPHLREYLYNAPLLGRQDTATPFGDVTIIARGQLYSAPGGFQFIQDPYQNDCDGCHNTPLRCDRTPCEYWAPEAHERLLALWTIKRIRHRDPHYGFKYDIEYKISPMSSVRDKSFIRRGGTFDYNIPGHKFVVQKSPTSSIEDSDTYPANVHYPFSSYDPTRWYPHSKEHDQNQYLPPILPPITEEYYDGHPNRHYGPDGYKDTVYGSTIATPTQDTTYHHDNTIGTLSTRPLPLNTTKHTQEADFLFPIHQTTSYMRPHFLPTNPNYKGTPLKTTVQTTLPATKVTTFSESTRFVQYSEPDPLYSTSSSTTTPLPFSTEKQEPSAPSSSITTNYYSSQNTVEDRFPSVYDYMGIGEHAITVVTPPNIPIQNSTNTETTITSTTETTAASTLPKTETTAASTRAKTDTSTVTTESTPYEIIETSSVRVGIIPTTPKFRYITRKRVVSTTPIVSTDREETTTPTTTTISTTHQESKATTTLKHSSHPTTISTPLLYITTNHHKKEKDLDDEEFEDEIFGKSQTAARVAITKKPKTTLSTDLEDIFGSQAEYFEAYDYDNPPTQPPLPKIIFSNFYLASTEPNETTHDMTTGEVTETTAPTVPLEVQNKTTIPITSQSYITSVSFEVNKKNVTEPTDLATSESYFAVDETTTENVHTPHTGQVLDRLTIGPFKYVQKKDMRPVKLPKVRNLETKGEGISQQNKSQKTTRK
ncbi:chitinase-like protein PB1E7.04c isoform X2 [Photinus pyralis]|uniref:chitinase-like protein PB1E7.04c isoform X2 n=1 Tax=Photinus pyralis TaxID=7054 RepID=UPI00126778CD|nr:chitinase-like protein PB1E7.04c isoform X2 [Photinus pyralis]